MNPAEVTLCGDSGPQRYTVPEGDNLEESGTPYYGNNIKGIHTMLTNTNAYQHQEENDYMIVVLHACRGGRPLMTDQGLVYSPSYAQKLSQNIDGEGTPGIVIAPDTRVTGPLRRMRDSNPKHPAK